MLVVAIDEAAQLKQRIGEDDLFQVFAALEGEFADGFQLVRQVDGPQGLAILEGAGADGAQLVAEFDARQRSAAFEGALADLGHAVRQGHGFQRGAVPECARADLGHAVRNDHVAAGAAVGHEHAGFDFEVLREICGALKRRKGRVDFIGGHRTEGLRGHAQRFGQRIQGKAQLRRTDFGGGARRRGRSAGFGGGFCRGGRRRILRGLCAGRRGHVLRGRRRIGRCGWRRFASCGRISPGSGLLRNNLSRCGNIHKICVALADGGQDVHQQRQTGERREYAQPDMFHFHTSNENNPSLYQLNYTILGKVIQARPGPFPCGCIGKCAIQVSAV